VTASMAGGRETRSPLPSATGARAAWYLRLRHARRAPDVVAIGMLVSIALAGEWDVITGSTILGMDAATAFYPWYAFLGESLRAGTLPAWNPHQFAGTPFAADPESGWIYLPAMVLFSLFTLPVAARIAALRSFYSVMRQGVFDPDHQRFHPLYAHDNPMYSSMLLAWLAEHRKWVRSARAPDYAGIRSEPRAESARLPVGFFQVKRSCWSHPLHATQRVATKPGLSQCRSEQLAAFVLQPGGTVAR
jgi:hypothetical protein